MHSLPASLPRTTELPGLHEDPLRFLARARSRHGDLVALREGGPIFSRSPDCAGAVAVFGPACHRAVLSDGEVFGMPVSGARLLGLPPRVVNLTAGAHGMRGERHARHRRALARVLGQPQTGGGLRAVRAGFEAVVAAWRPGRRIDLLAEMRRLAHHASCVLLFGELSPEARALGSALGAYFHVRREATSPVAGAADGSLGALVALGTEADDALRRHLRWVRRQASNSPGGLVGRLAHLEPDGGTPISEDELVAHANVLFVSSTEPIAVALTWTLLLLSQLPRLRRALRRELERLPAFEASGAGAHPPPLLDFVVRESLRVLTPNALMVRVTTRPATLQGVDLPERCELVLCPFLAHRDPVPFPRPHEFLPERWATARPSPFEYFPFGAGGHHCVGRHLATSVLQAALALLVRRYDLVLSDDQEVDWRVHIMLLPRNQPVVTIREPGASSRRGGRLLGAVRELVTFDACEEAV